MRTKITLECTECKQRNYNLTKDKKNHPDRMETKKYCRFVKHTHYTKRQNNFVVVMLGKGCVPDERSRKDFESRWLL